jgi:cell division protein FtsI (penicillin-binding protein 3)
MKDKGRSIFAAVVVLAVFAGLGVRLAFLHLKPSESTLKRIEKGRHLEEKIRGPRGRILDRNGNILAVDVAARHVCADPSFMLEHGDVEASCDALVEHLGLPRSEVMEKLNQSDRRYVRIKKYLREKITEPLQEMKLKGLIFEETSLRNYPKGALAAQVIGFANYEGVGSAGVEQKMNSYLEGSTGLRISQKDGRRREIYSRRTVDIEPEPGADVYLTIDQQIQYFTEKALDDLVVKYEPKAAWALVQDVRTGEILAMASWPTYNPNRFGIAPAEWMRNRAINYTYEPGSTMKAMVIASALDSGVVTARDMFDCENGRWVYGGKALHDSHGEGVLSVGDILKKSSNIGAAKIALQMGNTRLYENLKSFGFGSKTGIDLPGEDAGIVWNPSRWSKISATRLAMGHEVLVTSMQVLSALSAIANDGVRMRPQIIKKIISTNGETLLDPIPEELGRPIRPETAKEMRRLLARVTQPGGTGTKAALRGYLVAGKTGTAQKVNLDEGGYYSNKYIASFAGFLPVENPAVSIMVVADDPQRAHYGGTVCAPAFQHIADQTVRYLRISPDGLSVEYTGEIETALPLGKDHLRKNP